MRTAVIVHGLHLQAQNWFEIAFGKLEQGKLKKGKLGRIPAGIMAALDYGAELVIWSTGASQKDGLLEAEYTHKTAIEHIDVLTTFFEEETLYTPAEVQSVLHERSTFDTTSQNTVEELRNITSFCEGRDIEQLVMVSSPTHMARCFQEYMNVRYERPDLRLRLALASADTCYKGSVPSDVIIVEPPHRGDRPSVPFHKTVRQIFSLMSSEDVALEFNRAFQELIDKYKSRL